MATERNMDYNTNENTLSCIADNVKAAFYTWLSNEYGKLPDANTVITSLEIASEQLLKRKLLAVTIWEVTKSTTFAVILGNARDDKFFRIFDKKNYSAFIRYGQLYLKFLKSKPQLQHPAKITEPLPSTRSQSRAGMTIKEAVTCIFLEERKEMTAEEIYERIVEKRLYSFGAQNPINVVRNIIESACDNSTYSKKYQASIPCFHFEKNEAGKRVYSLLETKSIGNIKEMQTIPEDTSETQVGTMIIWDDRVKQAFQKWLVCRNYARRTVDGYCRAASQIFREFASLATKAASQAKSELDAVRNYIALLNNDSIYTEANASGHNLYSATMGALERFYSSAMNVGALKDDEQMPLPSTATSSLSNIVGLEEGREGLKEILEAHFQTLYGYSNLSIVWNAAQNNLSLFLNDNAINTAEELWQFLYRCFMGEYVMSNPHIWRVRPNFPQNYIGVIINLARQFGGNITREQIDEYFARIKQRPPINANIIRQGYFAFYAPKHFILTEVVDLSDERTVAITKALSELFEHERVSYIVPRDISYDWFSSLPVLKDNLSWTALLLQEVLRLSPAIGFRTVFSGLNGQAYDTLGAAIVPDKSEINSFADVVHRHCYDNELLGKRMLTEEFRIILRDAGMLGGNELIYNLHKALRDYRFVFTDENKTVKILEK